MQEHNPVFHQHYMPFVKRWGKITGVIALLVSFGPVLVLGLGFGLLPDFSAILTGFIAIASVVGVYWFVEPISYFPVLGITGTYISFISGNIANLRLPCAAAAQQAAEVETGTEAGTIVATLGIAASVVVNIVILALGVFAGSSLLTLMPPSVTEALNYLLPALFGAVFAQFALMKPKLAPFALAIALLLTFMFKKGMFGFLGNAAAAVVVLGSVFGTIAVALLVMRRSQSA